MSALPKHSRIKEPQNILTWNGPRGISKSNPCSCTGKPEKSHPVLERGVQVLLDFCQAWCCDHLPWEIFQGESFPNMPPKPSLTGLNAMWNLWLSTDRFLTFTINFHPLLLLLSESLLSLLHCFIDWYFTFHFFYSPPCYKARTSYFFPFFIFFPLFGPDGEFHSNPKWHRKQFCLTDSVFA